MTDEDLLALDKSGFIPGPGEKEENFLKRVLEAKKKYEKGGWIPEPHWDWVRTYLNQLFHVKPLYIPAFYSNKRLAPWQGAASWILGRSLDSVQLRTSLKKGSYLKVYQREEILAHEAVHAVRSGFEESVFEEYFAFMSSEKRWRRIFGPILKRPWEIWPFFLSSFLGGFFHFCYLFSAIWASLGFFRLAKNHRILKKAKESILQSVLEERVARSILLRLTDREITLLSKGERIESILKIEDDLRSRVIQNFLKGRFYGKKNNH